MKCHKCGNEGAVQLFTSVAPCDRCVGLALAPKAEDRVIRFDVRRIMLGTTIWRVDEMEFLVPNEHGWYEFSEDGIPVPPIWITNGPGWECRKNSTQGTRYKYMKLFRFTEM